MQHIWVLPKIPLDVRFLLRLYIEQTLTAGFIDRLESDNIGWTPPSPTVKLAPLTPRLPFRRPRLTSKKECNADAKCTQGVLHWEL